MRWDSGLPWEWDDGLPWESSAEAWRSDAASDEAWRGGDHLEDWPEELAGPEYWLYKRMSGEDE